MASLTLLTTPYAGTVAFQEAVLIARVLALLIVFRTGQMLRGLQIIPGVGV